jgi:hypothetical protein
MKGPTPRDGECTDASQEPQRAAEGAPRNNARRCPFRHLGILFVSEFFRSLVIREKNGNILVRESG